MRRPWPTSASRLLFFTRHFADARISKNAQFRKVMRTTWLFLNPVLGHSTCMISRLRNCYQLLLCHLDFTLFLAQVKMLESVLTREECAVFEGDGLCLLVPPCKQEWVQDMVVRCCQVGFHCKQKSEHCQFLLFWWPKLGDQMRNIRIKFSLNILGKKTIIHNPPPPPPP